MKTQLRLLQLLMMSGFLCFSLAAHADEPSYLTTYCQLSLVNPVQLFPENYNVDDFRFNLIYGVNENVDGVDLGLVNQDNGYGRGLELGLVNLTDKDFKGAQLGLFNHVQREFSGVQLGLIANITGSSFEGVQVSAFYNDAEVEVHGLQIALVNHAGSLDGLQIGLLNFNDDTKYLGFLPFVNAAF